MQISTHFSLIGNTPMLKINNFDTGKCSLYVKMESFNPTGSLKDRLAFNMIETAEKQGKIKPGDTLLEATSGSTALSIAHIALLRGYKCLFVVHNRISKEKLAYLKAIGSEIVITDVSLPFEHPDYYQNLAARIAKERPNTFYLNQFNNPANPEAYEKTLAPEIWQQMNGKIDTLICGAGTGGHMTGVGRFLRKKLPDLEIILADPIGSVLAPYVKTGKLTTKSKYLVEGIGEDFVHPTCQISLCTDAIQVRDYDSFMTSRDLLSKEGIFAGMSSGTVMWAALKYCRAQTKPKNVVTFIYDNGHKYLSKIFDDEWMKKNFPDEQ